MVVKGFRVYYSLILKGLDRKTVGKYAGRYVYVG